jgi:hypothetical protein
MAQYLCADWHRSGASWHNICVLTGTEVGPHGTNCIHSYSQACCLAMFVLLVRFRNVFCYFEGTIKIENKADLEMEKESSSETSETIQQFTRRHMPEGWIVFSTAVIIVSLKLRPNSPFIDYILNGKLSGHWEWMCPCGARRVIVAGGVRLF